MENNNQNPTPNPSPAVIKRLPRYYRYLRELIRQDKLRISSSELSQMMNVTASQIRQDLNCFGGFGQQGYGYNVNYLFARISEILGVGEGFHAVIIGAGFIGLEMAENLRQLGMEVTIVGQDGDKRITMEEIARLSDKVHYEIMCIIGKRVPRVYTRKGENVGVVDYVRHNVE